MQVETGGTDHTQLPVVHQTYRYLLEKGAHNALVEEPCSEAAGEEAVANLGQDAARKEHAAAGAVTT